MGVVHKVLSHGRRFGWRYTVRKVYRRFYMKYIQGRRKYPYSLPEAEHQRQREEALMLPSPPLISIIVPLFHTPEKYLKEMLDSVRGQTYPNWELCLADASGDNGLEKIVREFEKKAGQQALPDGCQGKNSIRYLRLERNGGIGENSNAAAKMAAGEYIALLDHDDLLHPSALYEAAEVICKKKVDFVYTDELSFVKKPSVVQSVHLKSDFRWEHLRGNNYICHLAVFSRKLFWRVGGFRQEYDGAQDYDLFLRMAEECREVCHIPKVLYYWRIHEGSSAAGMAAKPYVAAAGKKALEEHLKRMGLSAAVEETELGPFYRVSYYVPEGSRVLFLAEDEDTAEWLRGNLADCPYVVSVWCDRMEYAYHQDVMDYVVLVRRGYRPLHKGYAWLAELLGGLQWQEHSLAGALIYNKKERVEHAGFYDFGAINPAAYDGGAKCCLQSIGDANRGLQSLGGVHPRYQGAPKEEDGYMNHLRFTRVVDYLYGAVLAMRWEDCKQEFKEQIEEGWEKVFARETWFSLCSMVKKQGKYSVLTVQEPWIEAWRI